jgi:hypothetical protein
MLKTGLRVCHRSIILAGLCLTMVTNTAQSTVRLESWQSYGGMAEQGAICAAFSRLMELQTLVNPRLGKLWQERQNYAGSVINKAANLEGLGDLTPSEISVLVDRYATWLMFKLTETGYSTTINGNSHDATSKMIGDVCTQIYQRADQSIIKTHPDLAACAIAGNCIEPAEPDKHAAPMAGAKSTDQLENLKRLMHQNLALQQRIDTLESSVETVIPAPEVPQPNEHQKAKDHTKAASPVMPSPQGQTAKKNIGMTGLDIAFSIPAKPGTTGYVVQIGTYRTETDAYRAQYQLEQSGPHPLKNVTFTVAQIRQRNITRYSLVSAPLAAHHVADLCAVLWQHKMGCSASYTQ